MLASATAGKCEPMHRTHGFKYWNKSMSTAALDSAARATAPLKRNWFYWLTAMLIRLFSRPYFRVSIRGAANVPPTGPLLMICNHVSNLDPPLVGAYSPRECHALAKEELFRAPIVRWLVPRLNTHPIHRAGIDRAALRECERVVQGGAVLLVFPEGTRSPDGNLQEAKAGAAMIALHTHAPILPVYIEGTFAAMGRGKSWPRPSKITITFGEVFHIENLASPGTTRHQLHEILAKEMMKQIAQVKSEGSMERQK